MSAIECGKYEQPFTRIGTMYEGFDTLRKIQRAGKLICVEVPAKGLPRMLANLAPKGVLYQVSGVESEAHAWSLMALAEQRR